MACNRLVVVVKPSPPHRSARPLNRLHSPVWRAVAQFMELFGKIKTPNLKVRRSARQFGQCFLFRTASASLRGAITRPARLNRCGDFRAALGAQARFLEVAVGAVAICAVAVARRPMKILRMRRMFAPAVSIDWDETIASHQCVQFHHQYVNLLAKFERPFEFRNGHLCQ